ncbi:hypothetical protein ACQP25_00860 [Microtetraspora malaysiensis]|uniref:hypothetical protein n=1 Tax=Microtetraspora malaysiensis TaxID=161358 RepID=UPI003D94915E
MVAAVIAGVFSLIAKDDPTPKPERTTVAQPHTKRPTVSQPNTEAFPAGDTSIFSNPDNGTTGTTVLLSGEGFPPGSRVTFYFSTTQIGTVRANNGGKFSNVAVKIPKGYSWLAPHQFYIVATAGGFSGRTPFTLAG